MPTQISWKVTCLFAAMLVASGPLRADDQPATANKPVARRTDAAAKAKSKHDGQFDIEVVRFRAFDDAKRVLYSGVQGPSSRKLGVAVTPADAVLRANVPATKGKLGLVVTSVVKDSPAAKAQIHTGDILLKLAAKDLATVSDLTVAVQKAKSPADARLVRSGKTLTVRVRFPESAKTVRNLAGAYDVLVRFEAGSKYTIGVSSKPVDATLASQLVLPPSTGFIINHVAKDGAAAKAGLKQHDVILTVADQYVTSEWDLGKALDKAAGKPVKMEFIRSGRKQSCTVTPAKRAALPKLRYWSLYGEEMHRSNRLLDNWKTARMTRRVDMYGAGHHARLDSEVERLSKQIDDLKKTLDALKKQLSVRKTKVKVIKSK